MPVTEEQLAALAPYIAGARPDERGELEVYCPMHPDTKRSASVNVDKGVWYCHAGCGGGSVRVLVMNEEAWVPVDGRSVVQWTPPTLSTGQATRLVLPTMDQVQHWHRRLRRERKVRRWVYRQRGITEETARKALLGYDGRHLKIPVFSPRRRLWNVRTYDMSPNQGRSKIWNTRGFGRARLYPAGVLARARYGDAMLFCEGEWDTLLALQHGHLAVTRTDGAGKPWHDEWTVQFAGLRVYMCHDRDRAGVSADAEIRDALLDVAKVHQCLLPLEYREQGGGDLTNYLLAFRPRARAEMLADLLAEATPMEEVHD